MEKASPLQNVRPSWAIAIALIVCAVAGVYGQSLGFGFIDLDDGVYVTQNPRVGAGLTWAGIQWAFQTLHGGFWIPLTWLSLMADQSLFAGAAWGFHLTNMVLHAANSILVLWVLFRFTGAFRSSLIAALIFAIHPLHVESVAWISERKDVLFAFFFLLAMAAHGQYGRTQKNTWAALTLAAAFFSLAAKPMAVSLPAVLLLLDFWPLDRFSREKWTKLLWEKAPLALLCLLFGLITLYAQDLYQGIQSLDAMPLGERVGNAIYAYARYAWKSLWPTGLGVFYPHRGADIPVGQAIGAGLFFAVAASLAWKLRQKLPWLAMGWFFFLITLLPVTGLVQAGVQGAADRFMYLPLLGLIVAGVWTGAWLATHNAAWQWSGTALMAGFLVFLSSLAIVQAGYWKTPLSLYAHTLDVTQNNYMVHEYLGASLAARGHDEEAAKEFYRALAIHPMHGDALYGLGCLAVNQGNFREGGRLFAQALEAQPGHTEALFGLATAQMHLGRSPEARENLEKVLSQDPGHGPARKSLQRLLNGKNPGAGE